MYTAKAELIHKYFCDFSNPVENRSLLDVALAEALEKKHLHYGFKHVNPLVNRLKKATKDVHQKAVTIYKAASDPSMKATVDSIHFQYYLYDEGSSDPDEEAWAFSLGPRHHPLLSSLPTSRSKVLTPSTGLINADDGQKRSSRIKISSEQKRIAEIEQQKRFEEAQRFAEEQALLREQEKAKQLVDKKLADQAKLAAEKLSKRTPQISNPKSKKQRKPASKSDSQIKFKATPAISITDDDEQYTYHDFNSDILSADSRHQTTTSATTLTNSLSSINFSSSNTAKQEGSARSDGVAMAVSVATDYLGYQSTIYETEGKIKNLRADSKNNFKVIIKATIKLKFLI